MERSHARFRELESHFEQVKDLPDAERQALLVRLGDGDPDLADQLRRLLEADDAAATGSSIGIRFDPAWTTVEPGTRIGGFEVLDVLGRGAHGIVYRARQQDPAREVAVKLIAVNSSPELERRLQLEAELLANLQHPGIASMIRCGRHAVAGVVRPWFAMELIAGKRLDEHVAHRPLDERLRLFLEISAAVDHAHRKGVVHRDLKPSNILVDAEGHPKILDFGIARRIDAAADDRTRAGLILGTLGYMSPEQCAGRTAEVDTRSDVYALGAVLFELLTGETPHDLRGLATAEAALLVMHRPPRDVRALDATLSADLAAITAKALRTEPERRYASAAELAADVERFRQHRPVTARDGTTRYLLGRLVRRHRAASLLASGLVVTLVVALVVTVGLARNLDVQRNRAEQQARRNLALADQLEAEANQNRDTSALWVDWLVGVADPEKNGDRLESSAIRGRLLELREVSRARHPAVRADVLRGIGLILDGAGEPLRAREVLEEALRELPEPETALRGQILHALAQVLHDLDDPDSAAQHYAEAIDQLRAAGPRYEENLWFARHDALLLDRDTQSLPPERSLERFERLLDELETRQTADRSLDWPARVRWTIQQSRADLLSGMERSDAASDILREVAADRARRLGPDHLETAATRNSLGFARFQSGDYRAAAEQFRAALASREPALGSTHPDTLNSRNNLAGALARQGLLAEAVTEFERILEAELELFPAHHSRPVTTRSNLAFCLTASGQPEAALELLGAAPLEALNDTQRLHVERNTATALAAAGRFDEARTLLQSIEGRDPQFAAELRKAYEKLR